MPGNKSFEYIFAYYDPEEMTKTPGKRRHSVWDGISATSVSRAVNKFWRSVEDEEGWSKKDINLVGVMPLGLAERKDADDEDYDDEENTLGDEDDDGGSDEYEEEEVVELEVIHGDDEDEEDEDDEEEVG